MRPSLSLSRPKATLFVLALAGACVPTSSLPGTALGTYAVVGTLGTNTCGSGVDPNNPWDFTAQISKDGTTLYFANSDGSDEISGALASTTSTTATLGATTTANVDGSDAGGQGLCDLTQSTSLAISLASGTTPTSFSATVTYSYAAATGVSSTTNCTDQLSSAGGAYATLPCSTTYSLKGTRQ